jgi:hypothetical protein
MEIFCELKAYLLIKTIKNKNISKKIKSYIYSIDKEYYQKLKEGNLISFRKGLSNIPIIILVLEFMNGVSMHKILYEDKIILKKFYIDFIKQLFFILYSLYEVSIYYNDKNLNNFIIEYKPNTILDFIINDRIIQINVDYIVKLIDMDHVLFLGKTNIETVLIYLIINKDNIFYKLLQQIKPLFRNIVNYEFLEDKLYWNNNEFNTVNELLEIFDNL